MSRIGQRQMAPAKATALAPRPGALGEFGLGAALGWSGVVLCVLPTALIGGLVISAFTNAHQFWLLIPDLVALAAGPWPSIEIAFRGLSLSPPRGSHGTRPRRSLHGGHLCHLAHPHRARHNRHCPGFLSLGWVLAVAVLRTRALWVGWGFHFAWIAAMAMLFGLPVAGTFTYSPVLITNTIGPPWITGGSEGPEGSAFAVLVSCLLIFAMMRYTSDLKYKYGFPEIVPGGVPVDLDAAARRHTISCHGRKPAAKAFTGPDSSRTARRAMAGTGPGSTAPAFFPNRRPRSQNPASSPGRMGCPPSRPSANPIANPHADAQIGLGSKSESRPVLILRIEQPQPHPRADPVIQPCARSHNKVVSVRVVIRELKYPSPTRNFAYGR